VQRRTASITSSDDLVGEWEGPPSSPPTGAFCHRVPASRGLGRQVAGGIGNSTPSQDWPSAWAAHAKPEVIVLCRPPQTERDRGEYTGQQLVARTKTQTGLFTLTLRARQLPQALNVRIRAAFNFFSSESGPMRRAPMSRRGRSRTRRKSDGSARMTGMLTGGVLFERLAGQVAPGRGGNDGVDSWGRTATLPPLRANLSMRNSMPQPCFLLWIP